MLIRLGLSTCVNSVCGANRKCVHVRDVEGGRDWWNKEWGRLECKLQRHYCVCCLDSSVRHCSVSFGIEMHTNEFPSLSTGLRGNL